MQIQRNKCDPSLILRKRSGKNMSNDKAVRLSVQHLPTDEVYHDIARIPEEHRKDPHGQRISRGEVCQLRCKETGKRVFIVLYGGSKNAEIQIDNRTRRNLGVTVEHDYDFELIPSGFWGEVRWALGSGDVVYRFSSKVALVSLFLGLVGVALGVLALFLSRH